MNQNFFAKFRNKKEATATFESMQRIFNTPESENSTLSQIEKEISKNINGFLQNHIIAGDLTPFELEKTFNDSKIPENPLFVSEQAEFLLTKVVAQSVHTSSPSFIGHMTSALPYFMLPIAKIMFALNQNLVKIETSKAFTPLERQVIAMLHRLVYQQTESYYNRFTQDRQHCLGVVCSGGTIANMTSLWVARNRLLKADGEFDGIEQEGLYAGLKYHGLSGLAILVSKRGHYSLKKAADLLGIGKSNLIAIDTDEHNKINLDALRREIAHLKSSRVGIVSIIGVAGTTETGNVDPLDKLANISAEIGCHFHVDAAWGGPTLFSDTHKHLLKGIERADSVCIDAHKQLYVPIGAGVALFKDEVALNAIENHASYIIREGSRDLGKNTLEGTRPGMAMLIHSGLRVIGRRGYEMLIDHGIEKAKTFANMIEANKDFELITAPELNLLTYRFVPPEVRAYLQKSKDLEKRLSINEILNELTVNIQKEERNAGKTFVSRTTLEPKLYDGQNIVVFRCVLANPLTSSEIMSAILEEQRDIAARLLDGPISQQLHTIMADQ
jgi:glutamate decarboxylase